MKRRSLILLLVCEGAVLFAVTLLMKGFSGLFSSAVSFPFEQIGRGLRALSGTGRLGNGLALALWIGVSLVPALFALKCKRGKETLAERIALYVLSVVLLLALYGMVNPLAFCSPFLGASEEYLTAVKTVMGVSVWSVAVLYIVLRLIRSFRTGTRDSLIRYMRALLYVLCVLLAGIAVVSLANGIALLFGTELGALDIVIEILRLLTEFVPYVLDIIIVMRALELLDIAATEEQEGIVASAESLGKACCTALCVTTAMSAGFNVLQIILMSRLSNVATTVDIPVFSIVFVGVVLLLSGLLVENKRLRDDNSLFI